MPNYLENRKDTILVTVGKDGNYLLEWCESPCAHGDARFCSDKDFLECFKELETLINERRKEFKLA